MLEIKTTNKGAELISVKLDGQERLHDGETFWNRHAPILFPIVGRLKDDKTQINGRTYEMKQHGFARDMEFKEVGNNSYMLISNEETKKKFPFEFEMYVSYEVKDNKLITNCKVVNTDNTIMYFGLGFHPAFKCDYSSGKYYLEFEKHENEAQIMQLEAGCIDNRKIEIREYIEDNKIKLKENTFDKDAIILANLKSNKIILRTEKEVSLIFNFEQFPFLGIWSKKGAPFVCLEPWLNTADRIDSEGIFENKENILRLEPKQEFNCSFSVEFFK